MNQPKSDSSIDEATLQRLRHLTNAGAVSASMVHELRNILATISSSLFLAKQNKKDEAKLLKHLNYASDEIEKAHAVVSAVLGLARGDALHHTPTLLSALISKTQKTIVCPPNIKFETQVTPQDLATTGDPILLERVFSNLYINAIEAMGDQPDGVISTTVTPNNNQIDIFIKDNGPGIADNIYSTLFDPLVTTKETGTGLGLALTRTVIEAHNGQITAQKNESGPGACFHILLPILLPKRNHRRGLAF